ncbi:hypothetical protein NDI45_26995 [Leptolyngbya sp. GB1-A1]|uniref:SH3 domain-containing protein n=1 Tax=Leptolyngbya sp. GB1-A1 TaxID=2933908 RepID=UPI00329A14DC
MKLSRIFLYSGVLIFGATSMLSWQRFNATGAAQRRAAVAAAVQPAVVMPTATPSAIAVAPTSPQSAIPAPAPTVSTAPPSPGSVALEPPHPTPVFTPVDSNVQIIKTCNGQLANANLRSEPSLSPKAILGVVPQGRAIKLTGRTAIGDGEFWYEAIVSTPLYPSLDPAAINQLWAGQTGYLAGCFVGN